MDNLTLITCSYNTPDITLTMLKSFVSVHITHQTKQSIILIDNSTNSETTALLNNSNIPYRSFPGNTHGQGINEALKICKTDYALLVDTDIIFLKSHITLFEQFKQMGLTIMGKIEGCRGGKQIYNRVNPWHCFINVKHIKDNNIVYFDDVRMKDSFKTNYIYDIGSTFFEDVKNAKFKIGNTDLENNYFLHFEGMSWYKNKYNPHDEDTGIDFGGTHNNINFVHFHDEKYKMFENIKEQYKNVCLLNKFIY